MYHFTQKKNTTDEKLLKIQHELLIKTFTLHTKT